MSGLVSDEDVVFTVDGCNLPKQGSETVWVASQYCWRPRKGRQVRSLRGGRLRRDGMAWPDQL